MKNYNYKIQWLFNNNSGDLINCCNVIDAIGVKSLDNITFRDINLKIIDTYNGYIAYMQTEALEKTKEHIFITCLRKDVRYVELIKIKTKKK
jgi:hypothetical protein